MQEPPGAELRDLAARLTARISTFGINPHVLIRSVCRDLADLGIYRVTWWDDTR